MQKSEANEITNKKKYEIITDQNDENYGHIRALIDFSNVKKGDVGGKIDNYDNLSQEGDCWASYKAIGMKYAGNTGETKCYKRTSKHRILFFDGHRRCAASI